MEMENEEETTTDGVSKTVSETLTPTTEPRALSFGEKAVGLTFNPGGLEGVTHIKQQCADVIDLMDILRTSTENAEKKRLASNAITEMQTAQMWAVKALTWKD